MDLQIEATVTSRGLQQLLMKEKMRDSFKSRYCKSKQMYKIPKRNYFGRRLAKRLPRSIYRNKSNPSGKGKDLKDILHFELLRCFNTTISMTCYLEVFKHKLFLYKSYTLLHCLVTAIYSRVRNNVKYLLFLEDIRGYNTR